jgi:hypothetical protein
LSTAALDSKTERSVLVLGEMTELDSYTDFRTVGLPRRFRYVQIFYMQHIKLKRKLNIRIFGGHKENNILLIMQHVIIASSLFVFVNVTVL